MFKANFLQTFSAWNKHDSPKNVWFRLGNAGFVHIEEYAAYRLEHLKLNFLAK